MAGSTLAVAGDPQRRVRSGRPRLGVCRLRGGARRRRGGRGDRGRAGAQAGAAGVTVVNRTPARAEAAARLAGPAGAVAAAGGVASRESVSAADVVVNATPVGMAGTGGAALIDVDDLHAGQAVV